MDQMFANPPGDPRSNAGVAASVSLHTVIILVAVAVGARATSAPVTPHRSVTFINAAVMLPPPEPIVRPRIQPVPIKKALIEAAPEPAPKPQPVEPPHVEAIRPPPPALTAAALPVAPPAPVEERVEPIVGAFDRTTAARSNATTGVVRSAGFGAGDAPVMRRAVDVTARSGGFDREVAPRTTITMAPPVAAAIDTPVEVLFKPVADYTDEARALKLEGEVVLEVVFGAAGDVSVGRVVRGLGHGLDETAARAVSNIRFRPATRGGSPVAVRTFVHVEFKLT